MGSTVALDGATGTRSGPRRACHPEPAPSLSLWTAACMHMNYVSVLQETLAYCAGVAATSAMPPAARRVFGLRLGCLRWFVALSFVAVLCCLRLTR